MLNVATGVWPKVSAAKEAGEGRHAYAGRN